MAYQTYVDERESIERSIVYYQNFGKGYEGNPDRKEALEALQTKVTILKNELYDLNMGYYGTNVLYR